MSPTHFNSEEDEAGDTDSLPSLDRRTMLLTHPFAALAFPGHLTSTGPASDRAVFSSRFVAQTKRLKAPENGTASSFIRSGW